jgi:anti-sigma B factor antagonist
MTDIRRITVEGEMTIFAAQALKEQLLAALEEGPEIEVDLSRVSEMDSAGLQLMVAAKREAAARDKTLRFTGHSPAVVDTLDLCDLSGHFGDPVLLPRPDKETQ